MSPVSKYKWSRRELYVHPEIFTCKFCSSKNIIKYGHFKSRQLWWCKDCKRKFSGRIAISELPVMNMYYNRGYSFHDISDRIYKKYNFFVSEATIFRWINKYSRMGYEEVKDYHPTVGETWVANQAWIRVLGQNYCLVDIIDSETLFLLVTRLVATPDKEHIKSVIQLSANKAGKIPSNLIFLLSYDYFKETELSQDIYFRDIKMTILDKKSPEANNIYKIYYHSFNKRNKLISRLKYKKNIDNIINGWIFHYNFRRIHESLSGKSPAEMAGLAGI
jgi:transposase-like protein